MSTIILRVSDEEKRIIQETAKLNGETVSNYIRRKMLEQIEDEYDINLYNEAISEINDNPKIYSLKEVEVELDVS